MSCSELPSATGYNESNWKSNTMLWCNFESVAHKLRSFAVTVVVDLSIRFNCLINWFSVQIIISLPYVCSYTLSVEIRKWNLLDASIATPHSFSSIKRFHRIYNLFLFSFHLFSIFTLDFVIDDKNQIFHPFPVAFTNMQAEHRLSTRLCCTVRSVSVFSICYYCLIRCYYFPLFFLLLPLRIAWCAVRYCCLFCFARPLFYYYRTWCDIIMRSLYTVMYICCASEFMLCSCVNRISIACLFFSTKQMSSSNTLFLLGFRRLCVYFSFHFIITVTLTI